MKEFMTIGEAAALWSCSQRRVQIFCKQGSIPGAVKVSGVWLLPRDTVRPQRAQKKEAIPFQPETLYGQNVQVQVATAPGCSMDTESGCVVTQYEIMEGISLVFQDIHEETLDYQQGIPRLPDDLIAIQHCREGRFEGEYPDGECIYMGPGDLSVNLPSWAPICNSFPLRHYHGMYIAILPETAEKALKNIEKTLGPMHIDFHILTENLSEKNRLALYQVDEKIAGILREIYPGQGEFRVEQLKLNVLRLLQMLCTQQTRPPAPEQYLNREQVKTVKKIRQFLISHPDQHIPLAQLSARFHISLTAMKTCFKGVYGQSIGRYLREYRMQAGAELLRTTDWKIIEIAAKLGYENASKFSEAFSRVFGISPNEYRKNFCPHGALQSRKEWKAPGKNL